MQLKVAGGVVNQTPFDWTDNRERLRKLIEQARRENVSLLCLPELCLTGYGCEDAFFNPHVQQSALASLQDLLPATKGLVVTLGLPMIHKGVLFNTTAVICDAEIKGFVPKKFLAGDGVHYEPRWFKPWPSGLVGEITIHDQTFPFGDLHFDFSGVKVGLEICEEAWVAQRPGAALAQRGVDIILNPSASHFAFGKSDVRRGFVSEGSRAFNVAYVYTNLLGNEAGRIIFDGGVLIADGGRVVAQGPRFSFQETGLTSAVVDIDRNRVVRERTASYLPELNERRELCVPVDFAFTAATELNASVAPRLTFNHWEESGSRKQEEFSRAVALGLFDFLRKSRQNGFVVSLSGGVDSAAVTLLARLSLDFAADELGYAELRRRLDYIPGVRDLADVTALAHCLITTAYQSTKNSSAQTTTAARAIATAAGTDHHEWSVDAILTQYQNLAEAALKQKLSWQTHDSTLQNIQARARGPAIWMLANVRSALLLATSNRSEAAVGYATMDGDTCGGISPIGGIDKNFLRQWAQWMATAGPEGIHAFPALKGVLEQAPTAELRPLDRHQTDEEDLMPYDILDTIERLAIRDKKSPAECLRDLRAQYPDPSSEKLKGWVKKFFELWCRNQWKRERYAPAFHLDDESLDPKTWCRFPILSSGFAEELAAL